MIVHLKLRFTIEKLSHKLGCEDYCQFDLKLTNKNIYKGESIYNKPPMHVWFYSLKICL